MDETKLKEQLKKPIIPTIIFVVVIIAGVIGYDIIWSDKNSTFIDELYMTLITVTTVGYNEVYPLDTAGRIFSISIAVVGIGSLFYILFVFMENLVVLKLSNYRVYKERMKKIKEMKDHIVLIGLGRVGKLAATHLKQRKQDFVLVEKADNQEMIDNFDSDMLYVLGDATEDETLIKAGIKRARGVMVATANSATTVFVVLSSKVLNPDLFIVARSDDENSNEKLKRAGANRVVNPYAIGGQRLANLMVNTNVVDFIDTSFGSEENNLSLENIMIPEDCVWIGKTLKELDVRNKVGATILAVIRNDKPIVNPDGSFVINRSDQLVAFGTADDLKKLEQLTLS